MTQPSTAGHGVDVEGVVARAREGARSLAALPVAERVAHFPALRRAILERQEEIVGLVAQQTRKARSDILI